MSKRSWRLFLMDMLESIARVENYLGNITYEEFRKDSKTQDAVVRNLEIIGEAARHIPNEVQQKHAEIPWAQVVSLRNRLVHGYFVVDPEIVWHISKHELPQLKGQVEKILREEAV